MPEEFYDQEFPNLHREGWERTSEPGNYNCIAFAAGDTSRYWWPNLFFPEPDDNYWPDGVPHAETLDAFAQAFASCNYTPCDHGDPEDAVEKIAIYALGAMPRHAAIQQPNGKWRSKLGPHEDIETTLDGLVGPSYGTVALFMKRPRQTSA